jgi:hypothetical protein
MHKLDIQKRVNHEFTNLVKGLHHGQKAYQCVHFDGQNSGFCKYQLQSIQVTAREQYEDYELTATRGKSTPCTSA